MFGIFRKSNRVESPESIPRTDAHAESRDCAMSVDWGRIRAFAIERNIDHNGDPVTIIGHLLKRTVERDGVQCQEDYTDEWFLYCSDETHQRLVDEFNQ